MSYANSHIDKGGVVYAVKVGKVKYPPLPPSFEGRKIDQNFLKIKGPFISHLKEYVKF